MKSRISEHSMPDRIVQTYTKLAAHCVGVLVSLVLAAWVGEAQSFSSGITGQTLKNPGGGCGSCHSPNQTLGVAIAGPTSLAIGTTGTYQVNITGGTAIRNIGVDIATSDSPSTLSESAANLQLSGGEITHTGTLTQTNASGAGSYTFFYTMPAAAAAGSIHTLYAAARVDTEWNNDGTNHLVTAIRNNQPTLIALLDGNSAPGSRAVGTASALSTSGGGGTGAVTYVSSTTACSVSGTTLTAANVGSCTITATKAADATFNAASGSFGLTITQGTQTITFTPVAPKLASAAPFGVSATGGGSGNPVTYAASGVCTNSGAIVTLTGAVGTCTVTANQAGNANYSAAPTATLNITVVASGEVFPPNCQIPLGWATSAGAMTGWDVATDQVATGSCSLKSNVLPDAGTNLSARIEFTGTFLAGNITFSRRVSTEAGFDCLRFLVDGAEQGVSGTCPNLGAFLPGALIGASGDLPYATITVPISAGLHTLVWSYDKDTICCDGGSLDAVWIDNVTLPLSLPVLTSASTATGAVGVGFSYSITASNSPWGYTATGLPPGLTVSTNGSISGTPTQVGTYTVMTQSSNGAGSTTTAITITINRGPQTIPFAAISNKPVATVAFTLPAIVGGGSGNPVTYTASGVCNNFLSTVAYSSLGTCSVTANQLGDANYLDAAPVTQSFLVFDPAVEYFPANCLTPAGWFVPSGLGWSPALDSAATGGCSLRANLDSIATVSS